MRRYATRLASLHDFDRAILAIESPEKIRGRLTPPRELVPCWRASLAWISEGIGERGPHFDVASRRTSTGKGYTDCP